MRTAINGLGRIGRKLFKIILETDIELVPINDVMPIDKAVYLLKYDSTYGMTNLNIEYEHNTIVINNKKITRSL